MPARLLHGSLNRLLGGALHLGGQALLRHESPGVQLVHDDRQRDVDAVDDLCVAEECIGTRDATNATALAKGEAP
jgi:hypothetical protein